MLMQFGHCSQREPFMMLYTPVGPYGIRYEVIAAQADFAIYVYPQRSK